MKLAVVGAGISGLVCASKLHPRHDVHVFESSAWVGGHSHTVDVEVDDRTVSVDTGFIVHNDRNYPHFSALLKSLGVQTEPTQMSFGFSSEITGLEYSGSSISGLFAQRRNLFRPAHWAMLAETLRFFRNALTLVQSEDDSRSLGEFLDQNRFSSDFQAQHLLPMGAAIWSCPPSQMRDFPALSFARFFENHGLLSLRDRPQWRVIKGGSARYVTALSAPFRDKIRLETPVRSIRRDGSRVQLALDGGHREEFDGVVLACHSNQALAQLVDATPLEKDTLGSIRTQRNEVTLHHDPRVLPREPRAIAAWNYRVQRAAEDRTTLTYHMNRLQHLDCPTPLLVTLNSRETIDPAKVLGEFVYHHPVFDAAACAAQEHRAELGAGLRTAYCGAYWGHGFHEDGVKSGLLAAEQVERWTS